MALDWTSDLRFSRRSYFESDWHFESSPFSGIASYPRTYPVLPRVDRKHQFRCHEFFYLQNYRILRRPTHGKNVLFRNYFSSGNHFISRYIILFLTSLDISDVDTVLTWGTNVPPPRNKYFSEIFFPSYIKLTNNNPNKEFKSVELRNKKRVGERDSNA